MVDDDDPAGNIIAENKPKTASTSSLFSPIKRTVQRLNYVLGLRTRHSLHQTVAEAIEEHESSSGKVMREEEKKLLNKVIAFNDLTVEDVMTPRADIIGVEHNIALEDLKNVILREVHTRVPVYRNTLDDVLGFIHAKDILTMLCNQSPFNVHSIIRKALFVPPSMMVTTLLMKMQLSRVHMALVIDEFGGTCGLVTLEDLVEEIVGDIEDEHDVQEAMFYTLGQNLYEASARIYISDLECLLNATLHEAEQLEDANEYDTLGGLIFYMLGRVPTRGEIINHPSGLEFEIAEADLRQIKRVLIRQKNNE